MHNIQASGHYFISDMNFQLEIFQLIEMVGNIPVNRNGEKQRQDL